MSNQTEAVSQFKKRVDIYEQAQKQTEKDLDVPLTGRAFLIGVSFIVAAMEAARTEPEYAETSEMDHVIHWAEKVYEKMIIDFGHLHDLDAELELARNEMRKLRKS